MVNQTEIESLREKLHLVVDCYFEAFQAISEAIKPIYDRIAEAFEVFKSHYPEWIEKYYERKEQIESIRRGWNVKRDTRLMSQVIDRRPKVIVRKVI